MDSIDGQAQELILLRSIMRTEGVGWQLQVGWVLAHSWGISAVQDPPLQHKHGAELGGNA